MPLFCGHSMLASCKRDRYWEDPNAPYFRGRTEQYCVLTFAPVVYSGAAKRVVSPSIRRTHSHAGGPAALAFRNGSVRSISEPQPQPQRKCWRAQECGGREKPDCVAGGAA